MIKMYYDSNGDEWVNPISILHPPVPKCHSWIFKNTAESWFESSVGRKVPQAKKDSFKAECLRLSLAIIM